MVFIIIMKGTLVDKIKKNKRIIQENPFQHAVDNVVAEWVQLLLVIERIKLDEAWMDSLKSIKSCTLALLSEVDFIPDRLGVPRDDNLPEMNVSEIYNWDQLSLFFQTLDEGKKIETFIFNELLNNKLYSSELDVRDPETQLAKFIDVFSRIKFNWDNLNDSRFSYPHHLLLRSYIYGKNLLDAINCLIDFNKNEFEGIVKECIETFIEKYNIDNDSNIEGFLEYRHDFVSGLNDYILHKLSNKIIYFINNIYLSINLKSISLQLDNFSTNFNKDILYEIKIKGEIDNIKSFKDDNDDVIIKVPQEILMYTLKNSRNELIIDKLIEQWSSITGINNTDGINNFKDTENINELWDYDHFSKGLNFVLFRKVNDDNFKLSKKEIIRGIHFSIWFDSKSTRISDGAKEFSLQNIDNDNKFKYGTGLTIKQSYESVTRFSRRFLDKWILAQVKERDSLGSRALPKLLPPLNIKINDNIISIRKIINNYIPANYKIDMDIDNILKIYNKIYSLKGKVEDISVDCLCNELFDKKIDNIEHSKVLEKDIISSIASCNLGGLNRIK